MKKAQTTRGARGDLGFLVPGQARTAKNPLVLLFQDFLKLLDPGQYALAEIQI